MGNVLQGFHNKFYLNLQESHGGHGGAVVTHLPPASEQNIDQLFVLVSFAHKTILRDMICTVVLKAT